MYAINVTTILKVREYFMFVHHVSFALWWQDEVLNEDWSVKEGCGVHGT